MQVFGYVKALCRSFLGYPSSIFWVAIILPFVSQVTSVILFYLKNPFSFLSFPMESTLLQSDVSRGLIRITSLIESLALANVFYFVRRFFVKGINSAAPLAKVYFERYTKMIVPPMIAYVVFSAAHVFVDPVKNAMIYNCFWIISGLSHFMYIYCFDKMYTVKEGMVYPIGMWTDISLIITFSIFVPLMIYDFVSGSKDEILLAICSYSQLLYSLSVIIKNVFIALTVLEHRFLRLPNEVF